MLNRLGLEIACAVAGLLALLTAEPRAADTPGVDLFDFFAPPS